MNVIIPMMGMGNRFRQEGYTDDKPFLYVAGKMIIQRVIEPLHEAYGRIHIACRKEHADRLTKVFNPDTIEIHILSDSKGAAHTIYQVCNLIRNDEPVITVDCDTILNSNALGKITCTDNAILSFTDANRTGLYSYLDVNSGRIQRIVEKDAITSIANAGVYVFVNRNVVIDNYKPLTDTEEYLSSIVMNAIERNVVFKNIDISSMFDCVGTPHQLQQYCKGKDLNGKIFCFDLDKTLVYDVLENPIAIDKNVQYCNYVYENGAKVIIHTARGMLSTSNNLKEINARLVPIIESVLQKLQIKYHELIVGKPYADYYIDDKAIPASFNMEKATGYYYAIDNQSRSHHNITIQGNKIIKQGDLLNEALYYKSLPLEIREAYFPKVIQLSTDQIVMQRIEEKTLSNLYTNGKLTCEDVRNLLDRLYSLHNLSSVTCTDWAYSQKVLQRYHSNVAFYDSLGITIQEIESSIPHEHAPSGSIIHGDPVFTNVFCNGIFIDPRGNWDGIPTIYGDRFYDYAKVLQSIIGYDFVLQNMHIPNMYIQTIYNAFKDWFQEHYPERSMVVLHRLCNTLILSMLPLHKEDMNKCKRYVELIHKNHDNI